MGERYARSVDRAGGHRLDSQHHRGRRGRHRIPQDEDIYEYSYTHEFLQPDEVYPETDEGGGRIPRRHALQPDTQARRRWLWLTAVSGVAVGTLLCVMPLMWGSSPPPQPEALPIPAPATTPAMTEEPIIIGEIPSTLPFSSPAPRASSAAPSVTPTVTTQAPTQSPAPVLLGPANGAGVESMVQRYCDRHTGGSADPDSDGRWRCRRLLSSSSVDLNVACRDVYGAGTYARTTRAGDPYAWRCYR